MTDAGLQALIEFMASRGGPVEGVDTMVVRELRPEEQRPDGPEIQYELLEGGHRWNAFR